MAARSYPETTGQQVERGWRFGWIDAIVVLTVFVLLWLLVVLSGDMRVRFDELHPPPLSLDVALIPYYTARTVLRMFIAFAAALLFTFVYGYVAAKSVRARKVMLPLLDILQSVPVLGFLSITVTGFLALFPGSLLGVECASIFAIFTAQAWNMTFGFYHSLITIPAELQEAASVYQHESLAALHQGRAALVRDRPDVELDDELRRRLVLRRAKRSHFGPEQEHQAARIGLVHGRGGGSGRYARRRLRHRRDDRHHRRHRSAAVAAAGGVGGEVQAGADRRQGQPDVVGAGSAAALVRAGLAFRSCRSTLSGASRSARPRSARI